MDVGHQPNLAKIVDQSTPRTFDEHIRPTTSSRPLFPAQDIIARLPILAAWQLLVFPQRGGQRRLFAPDLKQRCKITRHEFLHENA
jgi:hypothetical protein